MLGVVIGSVGIAWAPVVLELLDTFPILEPVETHIHRFCGFWLYLVVDYAISGGVVSLDWCLWLGMAEFFESLAHWDCNLCVVEESAAQLLQQKT